MPAMMDEGGRVFWDKGKLLADIFICWNQGISAFRSNCNPVQYWEETWLYTFPFSPMI